jgi:hypothetical protein
MQVVHSLCEHNLGHHPFVFVIQEMAVKYRHALDDRVSEVKDDIHRSAIWSVDSIQPRGVVGGPDGTTRRTPSECVCIPNAGGNGYGRFDSNEQAV